MGVVLCRAIWEVGEELPLLFREKWRWTLFYVLPSQYIHQGSILTFMLAVLFSAPV
jgi:hypothetical protein